jgi:hypothetical protein
LLASAFSPLLAVMVLLAALGGEPWLTAVLMAVALAPIGVLALVLRALRRVQATRLRTTRVRARDLDVLGFVSSYVLPVAVALFAGETREDVASLLLLGLLAVVYVRAGLYHLNPALTMLGYRLYEVEQDNGAAVMVLTRARHLPQRGDLDARRLADGVLIQLETR